MQGSQKVKNEDVRVLRGEYLKIDRDLDNNHDAYAEVGEDGEDKFDKALNAMEGLRGQVHRPREFQADTRVYSKMVQIGADKARRLMQTGSKETAGHLVTSLNALFLAPGERDDDGYIPADAFNWAGLGDKVAHLFAPGVGLGGLLGPLEVQPKEAKPRAAPQRRVKVPDAPVVRVQEAEALDERERQETDRNMGIMHKIVASRAREGQATRLLNLVLNWTSFAQTIENMFALSFLVKDGRVGIKESDEGLLVHPVARGEGAGGPVSAMQFVVSIDMRDWEALKAHCARDACLMPNRVGYQGNARLRDEDGEGGRAAGAGPSGNGPRPMEAEPDRGAGNKALVGQKRGRGVLGESDDMGTETSPPEAVKALDSVARRVGNMGKVRHLVGSPVKKMAV